MRDKKARAVKVKNLMIGGGFPVTVQTMWKKPLEPVSDLLIARKK